MDDYARGLSMLRVVSRAFSVMAAGIGYPIGNPSIPTAQVSANLDSKRIEFEINPHFIHEMKDSEIAAVIAHETYHVLLGHLGEMADFALYPKRSVLIDAQECIINDGLPGNVGFTTPEGTFRGMERHDQDFADFSTQEGYDFILQKLQEEEKDEDSGEGAGNSKSDSSDSGAGNGSASEKPDDDSEGDDDSSSGGSEQKDDADGEDEQAGSGSGDSEEEADDSSGSDSGDDEHDASCAGPQITGEEAGDMSQEEIAKAVKKILGKAVDEAVDEMNAQGVEATPELEELIEGLTDAGVTVSKLPNYGNPNAPRDAFDVVDHLSGMNMNWVELLAIINPKMKTSGRPKFRDAWHAPRRKMLHSYPEVILPTRKRLDDPNEKKGDSVPTFILALDMSGSIPTALLKDLASLAQSIPDKLIKGFPITWSDNFKIFDPDRPNDICHRSGTRIEAVQQYADQVRREEGVDPYVLVITDGGFYMPGSMDAAKINEKWYWMSIESSDKRTIINATRGYSTDERVFDLKDFI